MFMLFLFFFFKQKTAYEMRISDWSSDVCSSDLKTTEIPADRASTGAFYTAFLETEKRNRDLIDSIIKAPVKEGSDEARIANFYKAYIDTQAIDAAGMKPEIGRASCRERVCEYV